MQELCQESDTNCLIILEHLPRSSEVFHSHSICCYQQRTSDRAEVGLICFLLWRHYGLVPWLLRPIHLRPFIWDYSFETTFIWDHDIWDHVHLRPIHLRPLHLRARSFETCSFEATFIWDFFIWDYIHLRPHSFETTFIWDHIHLRLRSFETTVIWDHSHLRPHSFETTFIWDHIHLRPHSFETKLIWDHIHFTTC